MVTKTKLPLILTSKYSRLRQGYGGQVMLGVALIFGYFLSRLINLTIIPVFADEAIYIRWAQVMRAVASLRFIPLSDGKQPLFMWLVIPFLKLFTDPLVAGRMVSVLSGFGTMLGIGTLSYLLFKKKEVAIFTSILYLIAPFSCFFDRMALADGLLSFFGIWFLVLSVLLINYRRLDLAMLAGITLGLGLITKSPAIFFAMMLPLTVFVSNDRTMKHWSNRIKLVVLWVIVMGFAFTIYNILRLGPEFHMIAIRNKDYIFSISEVLSHPLNPFLGNIKSVTSWFWILLTPTLFFLGLAGIFLTVKKYTQAGSFLLICFIAPLIAQSAVAKVFTSRYILFSVPLFLIFAGVMVSEIFLKLKNKILTTFFLALIFFFPLYQIVLLSFAPQQANLPRNERSGYLELWTSGFGIKEAADYLKEAAKTQKVLVGTEGYFGTLPDGLQIYLEKVPNIVTIGVGYPIAQIPTSLLNGLASNRVFLVVNDSRFLISDNSQLHLIKKYPKAKSAKGSQESLLFFEIKTK